MATECMFSADYSIDLKFQTFLNLSISNAPPVDGYLSVSDEVLVDSTTAVTSDCNNGNDGQTLLGMDDTPDVDYSVYTVVNDKQVLLYKTTIEGLYYAIKIMNSACHDNSGFIPPDKAPTPLADVGDDRDKACMNAGSGWVFYVQFFIGPEFKVPMPETPLASNVKSHGSFRLSGAQDDVEKRTVKIEIVQMDGTVSTPPTISEKSLIGEDVAFGSVIDSEQSLLYFTTEPTTSGPRTRKIESHSYVRIALAPDEARRTACQSSVRSV